MSKIENRPYDRMRAWGLLTNTLLVTACSVPIMLAAQALLLLRWRTFFVVPIMLFLVCLGWFLKLNWKGPHRTKYAAMMMVGFVSAYLVVYGYWLFVVWLVTD